MRDTQLGQTLTRTSTVDVVHVHAKTYVFLAAINFAYFAQMVAVVGSGFLAQSIQRYFGAQNESTWLAQVIVIFTVVLSPLFSQTADLWGRKWIVTGALVCGTIGAIVASRAKSMGTVIAGFCVMGISFGAQPLLHAVVSEILPRRERPMAQASINATAGIGAFTGICMGGALLRHNNLGQFRIYLYVAAGVFAMATLGVAVLYNPLDIELQASLTVSQKLTRIDWIGNLLFTTGLVLFCVALSWSQNPYPWSNARIIATFSVSVVLIIAFFIYEWRFNKTGILNHTLFQRRNFSLAIVVIFVEGLTFYAANSFFTFQVSMFTQQDLLVSGLHFGVCFLAALLFACLTGAYSSTRKSLRLPCIVGFSLILVFNICMASTLNFNTRAAYWGFAVILGAGIGIILPTVMVVAQLSAPAELISIASALLIATRSLGGTVGLAINTALFNHELSDMASNIAAAALPLGLPASSLGMLIGALNSQDPQLLASVPGTNSQIIGASAEALLHTYGRGFRDCWIASGAFCAVAVIVSFFISDSKEEFNAHIDAPAETIVAEKQARLEGACAGHVEIKETNAELEEV